MFVDLPFNSHKKEKQNKIVNESTISNIRQLGYSS